MRVAGAVGPTTGRNAAAGANHANRQRGGGLIVRAERFAGNRSANRDDATLVASVRPGAMRG